MDSIKALRKALLDFLSDQTIEKSDDQNVFAQSLLDTLGGSE